MRLDYQSMVIDRVARNPGDGPHPGASARSRYAEKKDEN